MPPLPAGVWRQRAAHCSCVPGKAWSEQWEIASLNPEATESKGQLCSGLWSHRTELLARM